MPRIDRAWLPFLVAAFTLAALLPALSAEMPRRCLSLETALDIIAGREATEGGEHLVLTGGLAKRFFAVVNDGAPRVLLAGDVAILVRLPSGRSMVYAGQGVSVCQPPVIASSDAVDGWLTAAERGGT